MKLSRLPIGSYGYDPLCGRKRERSASISWIWD